jgi:predicted site-specific integrase-resolvase
MAAARLGITDEMVRCYIKRGIIRETVKSGGLFKPRYLIPEREIERICREAEASGK